MKATILRSVALVAVLAVAVLNTNVSAKNKYYSNETVVNHTVVAKTVYVNDGQLRNHLKYNYKYDESSRVISKETLRWNEDAQSWKPAYKMNYSYTEGTMTVELFAWNTKSSSYNLPKQKSTYEVDAANQPMSQVTYAWDANNNDWKVNHAISLDNNTLLVSER